MIFSIVNKINFEKYEFQFSQHFLRRFIKFSYCYIKLFLDNLAELLKFSYSFVDSVLFSNNEIDLFAI